jgi:biopolymer transport protein ExbD
MKLSTFQKRKALDINMTPMIDVVFQLLIFFMTCSQVSEANREALQLSKQRGTEDQANAEIIININKDGELAVGSEPSSLVEVVSICLDESRRSYGGDASQLKITLRVDRRANCRAANDLIEKLVEMKVRKVRWAVQTGD